jgi:Suppressor of fused protein (SUFU)
VSDPEYAEWAAVWEARQQALQSLLGPTTGRVHHAVVPLELGGSADVLQFPEFVPGATYVTADLSGPSSEQLPSSLGQYELMICTRTPEEWAPNLVSRLARYTLESVLEPSETMDIAPALPQGSTIAALLFTEPPLSPNEFFLAEHRCGLLLCIGITPSELELAFAGKGDLVLERLKEKGIFPYTDLRREPVA